MEKILKEFNENSYVIGDTHFFHENIVKYEYKRLKFWEKGFSNQEDWLISEWNEIVEDNDIVLHLGDVLFKDSSRLSIMEKLKGRKILIMGNHDKRNNIGVYQKYFEAVIGEGSVIIFIKGKLQILKTNHHLANGFLTEIEGKRVMFTHYPVYPGEEYDTPITQSLRNIFEKYNCDLNIHGHTHSTSVDNPKLFNASVENINFKPMKIKDILKMNG